jgi:hypothetical protein
MDGDQRCSLEPREPDPTPEDEQSTAQPAPEPSTAAADEATIIGEEPAPPHHYEPL